MRWGYATQVAAFRAPTVQENAARPQQRPSFAASTQVEDLTFLFRLALNSLESRV